MQDPDNSNSNFSHSRTQSEDDIDMDTNTEGLLVKANESAPTFTDEFEEDLQREVAYAPGLMAATEGENVILSHQVPPDPLFITMSHFFSNEDKD